MYIENWLDLMTSGSEKNTGITFSGLINSLADTYKKQWWKIILSTIYISYLLPGKNKATTETLKYAELQYKEMRSFPCSTHEFVIGVYT